MSDSIELSRRSFLRSTLVSAGAAAATTVSGVAAAGDIPAKWAAPKCSGWSWEKPVKPIPADQIKETQKTDVVVIGAGLAGFAAALAAAQEGAKVTLIEKTKSWSCRGGHITAFNSKLQKKMGIKNDGAEIVRRLVSWGQGRMDERLLWMFAAKNSACMDWAIDIAGKHDTKVTLWEGFYKGPTYTEFPVTHFFYNKNINLDYTYGNSEGIGNVALMPCFEEELKAAGVKIMYRTPCVQFITNKAGDVEGVIAGRKAPYTRIEASKGVIIATGCYATNEEMRKAFAPYSLRADAQIYFPTKSNTGDCHIMAMQIGGAMQRNDNHAATVHLEAGAGSYGFLHVNARGERFMNEDVNTQSKSCSKELQPHGVAWTVYDANWADDVKKQVDGNLAGGLFYGQMWQPWGNGWNAEVEKASQAQHIKDGKVMVANTIEELAQKMGVPAKQLKATIDRYNELVKKGHDDDYGKRKELLTPIVKAPFYAGRLVSSLLAMSGGLHTDPSLHVLRADDTPIKGLYVCGAAAGDYFGSGDYPTICPGMNHGRALTFGRLAGILAAGGDIDKTVPSEA
jgi:succinate dehydrogenase/fumarate reductase flavoprotein subunit